MTMTWNVAPRYTAGSPAMVDADTARRVALQEQHAIRDYLDGSCGETAQTMAKRLGLAGIVWSCREVRSKLIKVDVITGKTIR